METTSARTGAEGNLKGDSAGLEKEQRQPPPERKKVRAMVAMDDSEGSFYALRWALDKLFNHSTGSPTTTISTTSPTGESSPPPPPPPPPPPSQGVDESNLVILVHVMEPLPHYAYPGGYVVESATKGQEKNAAQILTRASQLCNEQKVAAERVVFEGQPKEMICEAVEKMGVDVLVVGSRGLGQIKRALLGSVSDYCAHHATCPVVIVKLPKESPHHK